MESNENNWSCGEIVTLPRKEKLLKKKGTTLYERYIASRYICIREASEGQRGILMKVLGKAYGDQIEIVKDQPFCRDDRGDLFDSVTYFSYPFPSANEVLEALDIIRNDQSLLKKFEESSMHVNPESTFWVSDITRNKLFIKKPLILSGSDRQLYPDRNNRNHYRITFVYFYKGTLNW